MATLLDISVSQHSLISQLQNYVTIRPDHLFLHHIRTQHTLSYAQMFALTLALSSVLAKRGCCRNGRVVLISHNHWVIFPLIVGSALNQSCVLPLDPDLHWREIAAVIKECKPKLIIAENPDTLGAFSEEIPVVSISDLLAETEDAPSVIPEQSLTPTQSATLMIYTSGTTGTPKIAVLSEANLIANATALITRYEIHHLDRFYCVLPTSHMNAIMMTGITPLMAGASIYLSDVLSFKNAKSLWSQYQKWGITIGSFVPSIMALLLKLFPNKAVLEPLPLRFCFCGAAPLSAELWETFETHFSTTVYQGYGLTETTCWITSTPLKTPRRYDSVGTLFELCELRIDPEETSEVGEIQCKGPFLMQGYFGNPKLTAQSMTSDGFYKTGDLGVIEPNGHVRIVGRIKDIIIKNGVNVFAPSVDSAIMAHPLVKESKTIGIPDDLVGERIASVVVLHSTGSLSVDEIREWLTHELSRHMWPDMIEVWGTLPRGRSGKILIATLRNILKGTQAEDILAAMTSWKYKRARPSDPEAILSLINQSLRHETPLHFLAYWGVGSRDHIADVDRKTLDRLANYLTSIRLIPQLTTSLTLIFTDVHVANNAIPLDRMHRYIDGIRDYATTLGFETVFLSELWQQAGKDPLLAANSTTPDDWYQSPLRSSLIEQAGKHYEGTSDFESAAHAYYRLCHVESGIVSDYFPNAIFTTFNPPQSESLLPNLPKVYLYSFKERTSVKPWFDG